MRTFFLGVGNNENGKTASGTKPETRITVIKY